MNEDNNERLAEVYIAAAYQTIVVFPLAWTHEPYGNWSIKYKWEVRND